MKISAVILNWNRPADTVKAADSVLAQDYPHFDLVIWDNASTDDSKKALESRFGQDPRVCLVFADANYGVAGGRNRAFRKTEGELVLWLDSDAFLEDRHAFSIIAERVAKSPDVGAISFEVKRPDGHLMWPFSRPAATWRSREFDTMRVDGCSFAVRRHVFEKAGGFAEHFSPYGAEDQHFAFKVIGAGYRVVYLPAVSIVHAFAGHGRTPQQLMMHVRNMLLIPLELFPMPHALASFTKLAVSLGHDAWTQHQMRAYLGGIWEALRRFSVNKRIPLSPPRWRYFRDIVRTEKRLNT